MKRISRNIKNKSFILEEEETDQQMPSGGKIWEAAGIDMTEQAREGKIEPVIGRDKELNQVIEILARKTKDNPILIGEPGVGKTSVVDKLALLMASQKCPSFLKGTKLIDLTFNFGAIIQTGALPQLVQEIEEDDLIIFVDELHSLSPGYFDVLKPFLQKSQLHMIGASTFSEYSKTIEKDGAMERRFQKVIVREPSYEECMEMLRGIQEKYEKFHNVKYTEESLESFYKLSKQYIKDRFLPDKAFDLMDESGARIRAKNAPDPEVAKLEQKNLDLMDEIKKATAQQDYDKAAQLHDEKEIIEQKLEVKTKKGALGPAIEVTKEMVEKLVADKTGIPVESMKKGNRNMLKDLSKDLKAKIIGQDEAIDTVVKTIRRNRAGLKDPDRPEGVFLFVGPTGTGKTYLVKKLAEKLFGDEKNLIRIDMAEYSESHTGSKLFGSPPGYVGYSEGGKLTEAVRRNPFSIVLLDEIEKAAPQVLQSLLGVLEDGRMTDGQGRTTDFTNCVIIMTSNVGTGKETDEEKGTTLPPVGFKSPGKQKEDEENEKSGVESPEKTRARIEKAIKDFPKFSKEFLNRIDDIVIFQQIDKESLKKIAENELKKVAERIKETQNITLVWGSSVYKLLVQQGFDPELGARPLRRAVTKFIADPIATYIIQEEVEEGETLKIDYDVLGDELIINGKKMSEIKESRIKKFSEISSLFESSGSKTKRILTFSKFNKGLKENETEREKEKENPKPRPLTPLPKRKPSPKPEEDEDFDPDVKPEPKVTPRPEGDPGKIKVPSIIPGPLAQKKKNSEIDVVKRYLSELKRKK
jgi:ATP-dependent Clp protease ATP-binding subunit ClpC